MEHAVGTPADATIGWLHTRGIIDQSQLGAARRLQNRWEQHKDRFDADIAAIGPGLSDILWRVVIAGNGLREAETALGWPARAGKLVLCIALDRLVQHYANTPNVSGLSHTGVDR